MNEEHRLGKTLDSVNIHQYVYPDEIVVIANACTDRTADVARDYGIKVIEIEESGLGNAKNVGINNTSGNIVAFLDSDSVASRNLIFDSRKAIMDGYIGGCCNAYPLENTLRGRMFWRYHNPYCRIAKHATAYSFYRRDFLEEIGGFDSRYLGDDTRVHHEAAKRGKVIRLNTSHIETSMRRFEQEGYLRVTCRWLWSDIAPSRIRQDQFTPIRP